MILKKLVLLTILLCGLSTLFISSAKAADTIEFTGVDKADGYVLLWGTTSGGPYPNYQDLGLSTSLDLSTLSLAPATTYYFVVQAYNTTDGMSIYSNEVTYLEGTSPPNGIRLRVLFDANGLRKTPMANGLKRN